MIIDAHTHITDDGKWFNTVLNADPEFLIDCMSSTGIDKSILLPLYDNCSNSTVFNLCRKYPERFLGFATLDIHNINKATDEIDKTKNEFNLIGIKLHPRLQKFAPANEKYFSIYEKAAENNLPIIFDGFSHSSHVSMEELLPANYDKIAKKVPQLKIIIAHFGGQHYWDAYWIARANKNVYLDISYIFNFYKSLPHILSEFQYILTTLDEKIIFGTDFPEINPGEYLKLVKENCKDLTDKKLENIFSNNILKILNIEV